MQWPRSSCTTWRCSPRSTRWRATRGSAVAAARLSTAAGAGAARDHSLRWVRGRQRARGGARKLAAATVHVAISERGRAASCAGENVGGRTDTVSDDRTLDLACPRDLPNIVRDTARGTIAHHGQWGDARGGSGGFGGNADAPPPPGRRFQLDRSQSAHAENWTGQDAYGNDPDYEGSKFERGAQGFGGAMHQPQGFGLPQPANEYGHHRRAPTQSSSCRRRLEVICAPPCSLNSRAFLE